MTDLQNDKTAIVTKGGSKFAYKRVTSAGANTDPADTWHDGVYREKSNLMFNQPNENMYDEGGELVDTDLGDMEIGLRITSMQDDANLINFLKDETSDSYFAIFLERGKMQDTKKQEVFIPIARIERSYSSDAPGRRPDIKITPIQNATAVTPASVPTWAQGGSGSASGWTCAVDNYFVVKDTTIT
jgi:hypothetical protein